MGPDDDRTYKKLVLVWLYFIFAFLATAVTNSSLFVNGVGKLRVIDASVLDTPVGNNAPAIMVAEKAYKLIKNYHNLINC